MEYDPYIGRLLNNRYHVEETLGKGGYGVVYRATDIETHEEVALKLLRPVIANDHRIVARFRREGAVLFRLRSPHTVILHEFAYTAEGELYLVMELLKGQSLKYVVRHEAPIPWRRALIILAQVCSALSEAHAAGVIHRDLKPENIFLIEKDGVDDFVKILDFGIAKILDGDSMGQEHVTQLTGRGRTVGTIRYMSPEQILGRQLDARSDIYTLGVVLYRLLTARMPFPGARKPGVLITAQLTSVPKPPSTMREGLNIPPSLDQLVLHMLEKEPGKRMPNVDSLKKQCEAMLSAAEWDDSAEHSTVPHMQSFVNRQEREQMRGHPELIGRGKQKAAVVDADTLDDITSGEESLNSEDIIIVSGDTVDETGATAAFVDSTGEHGTGDTVDETGVTVLPALSDGTHE